MERITISLDAPLAEAFDALIAERGYRNRSEAMRDLLRRELESARQQAQADGPCVATLSYVYRHDERTLAERIARLQHAHHDLIVSTMHVHLDHDHCLESTMLRGPGTEVRRFAQALIAESGVRHGSLNLIGVDLRDTAQAHGQDPAHPQAPVHVHYRPHA